MNALPIPQTAPFAEDEIEILNRVVGPASPTQRAWLAGFLAGIDTAANSPQPAPAAQPVEPLTILYATESGNCERLAADMAKAARKMGLKASLVDMADLDVATLASARRLTVIAATWGQGDPPARALHAYAQLMGEGAPRLDGVEFGVLALGDTAYREFCAVGKALDARLEALGARRVVDRVDCDIDFDEPAKRWTEAALKVLAPVEEARRNRVIVGDFGTKSASNAAAAPIEAEITEIINLNSSRSDKQTIHLELAFDGVALPYKPGDSLDLYPKNDPTYVDDLLRVLGRSSDDALRTELTTGRDVTTLSTRTLENYASASGHPEVKRLLESGGARTWIPGRQLIDLFASFPSELSAEQIRGLTRPLAPRAYSIASSRREVGDEAHLLVSAVRYESFGRARKGVASCHVAERLKTGQRLRVKLRPARHFALPAPDRDIIMIGPGTGVAPFRAFIQERRATGASGRAWLFFGDRHFTHDFLYQLEWQEALKGGALTRMDIAFSRDAPEKLYVQDRMWDKRRDLIDWLEQGASFYVCGDAQAMAKDVRATLVRAYADVKALPPEAAEEAVLALDRGQRYLQDVY